MTLLITNANQLITLASASKKARTGKEMSELNIIESGSMLIEDDRIVAVGTKEELQEQHPELIKQAQIIDASGHIVMPGLVDAHTHLVFGGTRENEFQMRLNGATYMEIMNAGVEFMRPQRKRESHHSITYTRKHITI